MIMSLIRIEVDENDYHYAGRGHNAHIGSRAIRARANNHVGSVAIRWAGYAGARADRARRLQVADQRDRRTPTKAIRTPSVPRSQSGEAYPLPLQDL